ncbi:MAG: rhomboid family intramembrane serine protease [Pseudomonadota bacterium]
MPNTPAVNALPLSVILLILPIIGVEAYIAGAEARLWGNFDARINLITAIGVLPDPVQYTITSGRFDIGWLQTLLLYPFVHGVFLQTVFASMFLLALGKFVGEAMGDITVLAIFFISSLLGALAYVGLLSDNYPLFGAYPAAYGMIGGYTYILYAIAGDTRDQQIRAFQLIAVIMAINLGFALISGGPAIWVAELTGAVAGFATAAAMHGLLRRRHR